MVQITSVHHELYYSLRKDVMPVCDIKIEYWEHVEDEEDELETKVILRFFGHSLSLFFPYASGRPLTGQQTRRLLREAAQATFLQSLTIEEGCDDEINEHEVAVHFLTSRRELKQLDIPFLVTRFAAALDRGIDARVSPQTVFSSP